MPPKRLIPVERRAQSDSQARFAAAIGSRPGECPLAAFGHMTRHRLKNFGGRTRTDESFECCRIAKIGIDADGALIATGHMGPICECHAAMSFFYQGR